MTDRGNLREGPSKDYRTTWVFQRAGLPVEIIAEYETWRRTALIIPWAMGISLVAPRFLNVFVVIFLIVYALVGFIR